MRYLGWKGGSSQGQVPEEANCEELFQGGE